MAYNLVTHPPAEQGELRHVDNEVRVGDSAREPVEYTTRHRYRSVFRSPLAIAIDEIVALFPFLDEVGDQLGRILAVGVDNDVGIAFQIGEAGQNRDAW